MGGRCEWEAGLLTHFAALSFRRRSLIPGDEASARWKPTLRAPTMPEHTLLPAPQWGRNVRGTRWHDVNIGVFPLADARDEVRLCFVLTSILWMIVQVGQSS